MSNLITFGLVGDEIQKLKTNNKIAYNKIKDSIKTACNFWNGHINPNKNIVLQIGVFNEPGTTAIARAWKPYEKDNVLYSKVEYNVNRIWFKGYISSVFMHEIAHALGFGWESLDSLYNKSTGLFYQEFVDQIPNLKSMKIELDYGPQTRYGHWDEQEFGDELMTGIKTMGTEYILPVTIEIMKLFGHQVVLVPKEKLKMNDKFFENLSKIEFDRQKDVSLIDTLYEPDQVNVLVDEHKVNLTWWEIILSVLNTYNSEKS